MQEIALEKALTFLGGKRERADFTAKLLALAGGKFNEGTVGALEFIDIAQLINLNSPT